MQLDQTDDSLLQGWWTWDEMRSHRRGDLTHEQLDALIAELCRHLWA